MAINCSRNVACACAVILGANSGVALAEPRPKVTPVYKSDFAGRPDLEQWSPVKLQNSPNGQVLLGKSFAPSFTQKALPKHEFLRVRVRLAIIGHHVGTDPANGPDHWTLSVAGGEVLVHTNFRNPGDDPRGLADGIGQSYPDQYPAGIHAAQTGAARIGEFGFKEGDATYVVEMVFPHREGEVMLQFQEGMWKPREKNKNWAIAAIELEAISGPEPRTEQQLKDLWTALEGKDPVAANQAVRDLIASGKAGAEFIQKRLEHLLADRKKETAARAKILPAEVRRLVVALGEKEFQKRMAARTQLRKLHPDAIPLLEKELARKPAPEIRHALVAVIKSMRATLAKGAGAEGHRRLVDARARHALRILNSAGSGWKLSASTDNSPLATLHDGWVPEVMKGNCVPRFDLWNTEGMEQWVQYEYAEAKTFDSAEVFWFENKFWDRGAKMPASWSLSYLDGEVWKPVKPKGAYTTTYEQFDRVQFEPVETTAIRLTAKGQPANRVALVEFRLGEEAAAGEPAAGSDEGAEDENDSKRD